MFTEEAIIRAYAQVGRSILLGYLPRRSCIASARIAMRSLAAFGVSVQPVPVHFLLKIPALNVAYIAGIAAEDKKRASAEAANWLDLDKGSDWNGHVVLNFRNHYLIDPSFDQAFAAIAERGLQLPATPRTLVLPLEGHRLTPGVYAQYSLILDPPESHACEVAYTITADESFKDTPAWQDEAIPLIVSHVVSAINSILI